MTTIIIIYYKERFIMKKNGRKEVSMIMFEGVTVNGDFIFNASVFLPSIGDDWKQTAFKVIAYEDGVF